MKGIIIVAHGSRSKGANDSLSEFVDSIGGISGGVITRAFIQFGNESLTESIRNMASTGIRSIVIVPLFFVKGTHYVGDIEGPANSLAATLGIELSILPVLTELPEFAAMIRGLIAGTLSSD